MTKQLLGFFDSGLGGLTVLRRVLERHGPVPCVYLGDTARVPYGNRCLLYTSPSPRDRG